MKTFSCIAFATIVAIINYSCSDQHSKRESNATTDSSAVAAGEKAFAANCSSCHNFRSDGIGPQLGGITAQVSDSWISRFIKNPQGAINSGDSIAVDLFKKFHAVMPSFAALQDSQLNNIIAFLHTKKAHKTFAENKDMKPVSNPIPDTIRMSAIKMDLEPFMLMPPTSKERPFTRINKMITQDHVNYVLDIRGTLYALKDKKPVLFLEMSAQEPHFIENPGLGTGLGSFAFHPGFNQNGLFYTAHTEPPHTKKADFNLNDSIKSELQWVVTEWKAGKPGAIPFSGSHRELFRADMVAGMHGVQEITFNPLSKPGDEDYGLLYISVGDGACVEEGFPSLAHQRNKVWGTVLRIDPLAHNSANGKYGIPPKNPFANDPSKLGEIYALGFRNPNRISWTDTGLMLVSNIGQANIESVNIVHNGDDFAWPLREGPFVLDYEGDMKKIYELPANDSANHFQYPAIQYDHDDGSAVSGGFEYNGTAASLLKGKYIFGDIVSGKLFYADIKNLKDGVPATVHQFKVIFKNKETTLRQLCGDRRVDLRFAKDHRGEIYILTKADGMIYHLRNPQS